MTSSVPGVMLRVPNGCVVSVAASELAAREMARDRGYNDQMLEMKEIGLVTLSQAMGIRTKTKTNPTRETPWIKTSSK